MPKWCLPHDNKQMWIRMWISAWAEEGMFSLLFRKHFNCLGKVLVINSRMYKWDIQSYKYLTCFKGSLGWENGKLHAFFSKLQKHEAMHHFTGFDLLCLGSSELHYPSMTSHNLERTWFFACDALGSWTAFGIKDECIGLDSKQQFCTSEFVGYHRH